jgi:hypothetical protein
MRIRINQKEGILAKATKKYLPSHKRCKQPPAMRLTSRDKEIVTAVCQYRLLSSQQIEALIFPSEKLYGKRTVCQRRLQLLFHHGYLNRLPITLVLGEGRQPIVYVLDKKGADLVATLHGIDRANLGWQPKLSQAGMPFVQHSLAINDVRLIVHRLKDMGQWQVAKWIDDNEFKTAQYKAKVPYRTHGARVTRILPDGFCRLSFPGQEHDAYFFLEVDLGTMVNSRWGDKVKAYSQFRSSGAAFKHYGTHNFRVLTIAPSESRLRNLMKTTKEVGGDHYFWFASKEELDIWRPDCFLEPIWSVVGRDGQHLLFPK